MTAIPAVLDVIHVIAGLFAEQSGRLSASHVEVLFAALFVALHTRAELGLGLSTLLFAQGTGPLEPLGRH